MATLAKPARERPRALVAWSSGKNSAFALHAARAHGEVEVVGLLTTLADAHGRVSTHGVREELLDQQAESLDLPCFKVRLPSPCPDDVYERELGALLRGLRQDGITHLVFGDLCLADVRAWRELRLHGVGMTAIFPLWMRDTHTLAREMLGQGLAAVVTRVDPRVLPARFAGRRYDAALIRDLPHVVDPCGENGEFHTFACAGPMFRTAIAVRSGEVVRRDGYVFADVLPA